MAKYTYSRNRVAIIGMGVSTSVGQGIGRSWNALLAGKSGVKKISRFNTSNLKTCIGATVDRYDKPYRLRDSDRTYLLAEEVLDEALRFVKVGNAVSETAQLYYATHQPELDWEDRLGMIRNILPMGAELSLGNIKEEFEFDAGTCRLTSVTRMALKLAGKVGFPSRVITVTTACASGASAIGLAVDSIRRKDTELAVVVGADACICQENIMRFSQLMALSTANEFPEKASKPFDAKRDGFVMGEGAGCLVLADEDWAKSVGQEILGYIVGYGGATDSYHKTRNNPNGEKVLQSMKSALEDGGLPRERIQCINAHGTSTADNDRVESLGINLLFGEHTKNVKVTSNKSIIGHTLSGSGAIEAVFSLLSIREGMIPPTINYEHEDKDINIRLVKNEAEKADIDYVLSNSFGFGGQNVSLVIGGPCSS